MGQKYNINGGGKQGGGGPKPFNPKPPAAGSLPGSPGLLTSTGGLFGTSAAVYAPFMDTRSGGSYFMMIDPTNFNCEEDAYYYFPSPDSPNGVGRSLTIHKIIIRYRELGAARFYVGVNYYLNDNTDSFFNKEVLVQVPSVPITTPQRQMTFPDRKLHTEDVNLVVTGENPQVYIRIPANSGPVAITKIVVIGSSDEDQQI